MEHNSRKKIKKKEIVLRKHFLSKIHGKIATSKERKKRVHHASQQFFFRENNLEMYVINHSAEIIRKSTITILNRN